MTTRALDLQVLDADGQLIVDPVVFVRLASRDNTHSSVARLELSGTAVPVRFEDAPAGGELILRVSPSRYKEGALFARVDGNGTVVPAGEIRLPRRAEAWSPVFTAWRDLPASFTSLQETLERSAVFRLGRHSSPDLVAGDRYDDIDPDDESRVLAKLSLLNLYGRLREEMVPGSGQPWFAQVDQLLVASRERFIAEVPQTCWSTVRRLEKNPPEGYRKTPSANHKRNFEDVPGVEQVHDLASIKTRERKGNLQFTVARAIKDGKSAFLLDADIDENGRLLAHTFDVIRHLSNAGTHPIDIHEALRATFPDLALGYRLHPRNPIADIRSRVIDAIPLESSLTKEAATTDGATEVGEESSAGWQVSNLGDARDLLSTTPIGSLSVDEPIELGLAPDLSFGGVAGELVINPRGKFTVAVLNDQSPDDEDGILRADDAEIAEGELPPQLRLEGGAWLKFRAETGVKATGATSVAQILGLNSEADLGVTFADYRRHDRGQPTREALLSDIREARFPTSLTDVEQLKPGEALAFIRGGTIRASVTLKLSDLFTGQIGTLASVLGTAGPIAFSVKTGASVTAEVKVDDEFIIAFSRVSEGTWRAGLRKARSSRVAPSLDAGISVGFADEKALEDLLGGVVEGALGAPLAQVKNLLRKASLDSLDPVEKRVATLVLDRLGLEPAVATLDSLRERVEALEKRAIGLVKEVVRTRIGLGFAYEYSRITEHVNMLQATLDRSAIGRFHGDLIGGRTLRLAQSLLKEEPGIQLESFLNQRTLISSHSWGFTLSFGKWATLGGRDFKQMRRVQRFDLTGKRVQESYLGARTYKGDWIGEQAEWGVDLKADMKDYAETPRVRDYGFGLHLSWLGVQRNLSASELEEWLDLALIWRVTDAAGVPALRAVLAAALDRESQVSVHLTLPDTVMPSVLSSLAGLGAVDYAGALAASMPWMKRSEARSDPRRRRVVYEPLWVKALTDPALTAQELAAMAADRVKQLGHPEMQIQERVFANSSDPFSFSGLVRINGNTSRICAGFSRGANSLQAAIVNGARNEGTIEKAVKEMDDLWTQSHHVRALGVQLLDLSEHNGLLSSVTRTMTIQSEGLAREVVVTA